MEVPPIFSTLWPTSWCLAVLVKGEVFDATKHEALLVEQTDNKSKDNTVSEVLIAGYTYQDMILRHAKVKVAKYGDE